MSIKLSKTICEATTFENEYANGYIRKYSDGFIEIFGRVVTKTGNDFWFLSPVKLLGTYSLITTNRWSNYKDVCITAHYSEIENRLYFYPYESTTGNRVSVEVDFSFEIKGRWK